MAENKKINIDNIKAICAANKVQTVWVTEDNQVFLPKAKNHAQNHCRTTGVKLLQFNADGSQVSDKRVKTQQVVEDLITKKSEASGGKDLKDLGRKELHKILSDLGSDERPSANKDSIALIEKLNAELEAAEGADNQNEEEEELGTTSAPEDTNPNDEEE